MMIVAEVGSFLLCVTSQPQIFADERGFDPRSSAKICG
jgi:hypothetical protein